VQTHVFRNPQAATENFAKNEWAFLNHGCNCLSEIIRQVSSRSRVIVEIGSPFLEMMIPFVDGAEGEYIFPINRHKFGMNCFRSQASESEKANDCTLLHEKFKSKCKFRIFAKSKNFCNIMDSKNLKIAPNGPSDSASDHIIYFQICSRAAEFRVFA
jgi:hypothetical protein